MKGRFRYLFIGLLLAGLFTGVAVGQPEYYNNSTTEEFDQDRDTWMADVDMTLAGVVTLVSRVGTWMIGSSVQAPSGASAGALATGVLLGGLLLGMAASARVGLVAGGTLAMASIFAIVSIDAAPSWMYAIALFAIGLLVATVIRRQLQ